MVTALEHTVTEFGDRVKLREGCDGNTVLKYAAAKAHAASEINIVERSAVSEGAVSYD